MESMWHTTDVAPREGAEIVLVSAWVDAAKVVMYSSGNITCGATGETTPMPARGYWAYAPGEAE